MGEAVNCGDGSLLNQGNPKLKLRFTVSPVLRFPKSQNASRRTGGSNLKPRTSDIVPISDGP